MYLLFQIFLFIVAILYGRTLKVDSYAKTN